MIGVHLHLFLRFVLFVRWGNLILEQIGMPENVRIMLNLAFGFSSAKVGTVEGDRDVEELYKSLGDIKIR